MFHPRIPFRTLLPMLILVLLLASCIMPSRQDATPVPPPTELPMAEPVPEPTPEDLAAVVNQNANVRTGPGTDHAVAYWLTAGAEVTVVGRNADGTWLQIEHQNRPGWIFGALTDIGAEALAALPDITPKDMTAAEPAGPAEPTPEPAAVEEPTPGREPGSIEYMEVAVTGEVANLFAGPGIDHPVDDHQVRVGKNLRVVGRNADATWLQVRHPTTGALVWIWGALTDINAAVVPLLAIVEAAEIEGAAPPESDDLVPATAGNATVLSVGSSSTSGGPSVTRFMSVNAGNYHTCGVWAEGNAVCWGWDE